MVATGCIMLDGSLDMAWLNFLQMYKIPFRLVTQTEKEVKGRSVQRRVPNNVIMTQRAGWLSSDW